MLVSELTDGRGNTRVAVRIDDTARLVNGVESVYALALEAIRAKESLRTVLDSAGSAKRWTSPRHIGKAGSTRRSAIPIRRICI